MSISASAALRRSFLSCSARGLPPAAPLRRTVYGLARQPSDRVAERPAHAGAYCYHGTVGRGGQRSTVPQSCHLPLPPAPSGGLNPAIGRGGRTPRHFAAAFAALADLP